ncbi:ATP-dependent DNA helicase sgs1 [Mortierella sp. GBA30]|nr:ATP-dependent DNA helicase sgs1 [Mortierella sp. GBA30]
MPQPHRAEVPRLSVFNDADAPVPPLASQNDPFIVEDISDHQQDVVLEYSVSDSDDDTMKLSVSDSDSGTLDYSSSDLGDDVLECSLSNPEGEDSQSSLVHEDTTLVTPRPPVFVRRPIVFNREDAIRKCIEVFGYPPKDKQLEVVERISQGQDTILIAGCGWGKTLVYFLPLVLWSDRVIVVISPLRALIQEQKQKLDNIGIHCIALISGQLIEHDVTDRLENGAYRAVFMTPEIIFESRRLKQLWFNKQWKDRLQAVVLDEAHCVVSWSYGRLGSIRPKIGPEVAFVAVSATLPPQDLTQLQDAVDLKKAKTINVGNDRANIRLEVRHYKSGSQLQHLDFLADLKKTIVYFESRKETIAALKYLKALVGEANHSKIACCLEVEELEEETDRQVASDLELKDAAPKQKGIAAYHALMSEDYKRQTMEGFRRGDIVILLSTEAAGMGCDIDDIVRALVPAVVAMMLGLVGIAAVHAVSPDVTCTGTETITYQPGLLSTPQLVKVVVTGILAPCTSSDSGITAGTYTESFTATLSCSSLLAGRSGTRLFRWDNGKTSTFAFNRALNNGGGQTTVTFTGDIVSGEFAGDTVLEQVVFATPSFQCLAPPGLTTLGPGPVVINLTKP